MPIYEYVCTKCGNELEVIQSFSDKPKTKCPECKGKLKKLISMNSFHLKGGGWYKEGYSSSRNGNGAKAETKPGKTVAKNNGTEKKSSEPKKEKKSESTAKS